MKHHSVQSLLQHADDEDVERMAELSPMSDDRTKERLFRQIRSRTEQFEHWGEVSPAPVAHSSRFGGLGRAFAALAACAAIVGTGFVCANLMQDKKPMIEPGSAVIDERETENAIVYQEDERHQTITTLEEANALEFPWKGKVIQCEAIGDLRLSQIYTTTLQATDADGQTSTYDALDVVYRDTADPEHHGVAVSYFLMPAEYMSPDAFRIESLISQPTDLSHVVREENAIGAVLECGDFRIDIKGTGIRDEEMAMVLTEVRDAYLSGDSYTQTAMTLEEANALDLPWKGKILQAETLGEKTRFAIWAPSGEPIREMNVSYREADQSIWKRIEVTYCYEVDQEQSGLRIATASIDHLIADPDDTSYFVTMGTFEGSETYALLDCGGYYIGIYGMNASEEELSQLRYAIRDIYLSDDEPTQCRDDSVPEVPDVANYFYDFARKIMEQEGYQTTIEWEFDDAVDASHVIRTDPPAGTALSAGETVTLHVSRGAENGYSMVSCVGMPREQAENLLAYYGLQIECVYVPSDLARDTVIAQSIEEGAAFEVGDPITLTLSDGIGATEPVPAESTDETPAN